MWSGYFILLVIASMPNAAATNALALLTFFSIRAAGKHLIPYEYAWHNCSHGHQDSRTLTHLFYQ